MRLAQPCGRSPRREVKDEGWDWSESRSKTFVVLYPKIRPPSKKEKDMEWVNLGRISNQGREKESADTRNKCGNSWDRTTSVEKFQIRRNWRKHTAIVMTCLAAVVNASSAGKEQRGPTERTGRTSHNGGLARKWRGMSWASSSIQRSADKSKDVWTSTQGEMGVRDVHLTTEDKGKFRNSAPSPKMLILETVGGAREVGGY